MNQQTESKNIVLTVILTILIIGGWHYFYDIPQHKNTINFSNTLIIFIYFVLYPMHVKNVGF